MRGYLEYDGVEAHCLGRLSVAAWEALLHRPEEARELHQLEQEAAALEIEQGRQRAQLEGAERRAEDAWLLGDDERTSTAERAVKRLREALATTDAELAKVQQALGLARSRPQSADQAAAMRAKVAEFVASIRQASGEERLAFNRWLLAQEPAIWFRLHKGGRVELLVGDDTLGIEEINRGRDLAAIEAGRVGYRVLQDRQRRGEWSVVATVETDVFEQQQQAEDRLALIAAEAAEYVADVPAT
jgi:hypothetical protein